MATRTGQTPVMSSSGPDYDPRAGTSGGVQNPASGLGAPPPPPFNHMDHPDHDLPEHLQFWIDSLEAYCEAHYGHDGAPTVDNNQANLQWLRLVRLAVALPTQQALRARIPTLKEPGLTYLGVFNHMQEHFGALSSEFVIVNSFLDTTQKPGETFALFFDRLNIAAGRSGFSCTNCRNHITRHLAIRGTSSQVIRATALQD